MNPLLKLAEYGQSYWLDNLTRTMIQNGELKKRAIEQGLRGVTSNPAIFDKAISKSDAYEDQIKTLVHQKKSVREIYEALVVKDVQDACDVLRTVYDDTDGLDGYVSLEVSPYLAHDTDGTLEEARRLFKAVDRPNCFIKIPGTNEGVPAIEQALYEGINVNITLLFSIESYEAVAEAYVKALERRLEEGKSVDDVASVASFFLSRIDVLSDELINHQIIPGKDWGEKPKPQELFGKAAIASAKKAYQSFQTIFSGDRWEKIAEAGARVQRPLWASTSTKDPLYSDVKYVEPLIGQDTVNTLPERTIAAFADHGVVEANTIEQEIDEADKVFKQLKDIDIDLDFVTTQLVNEGIQKFISPFNELMDTLARKRQEILGNDLNPQQLNYGETESEVNSVLESLDDKQYSQRVFAKDGTLWKSDTEQIKAIENRLGWLNSVQDFRSKTDELKSFAEEIRKEGYTHTVLLGMGGSSLSSDVSRKTFNTPENYPEFIMLDSTDPEAVKSVQEAVKLDSTLFLVGSKSGTTTETISYYKYFYAQVKNVVGDKVGQHFVAITDPGTPLVDEAKQKHFRKTFLNPQDIGGRYSVLSYFGLLPMALMGIEIDEILDSAYEMLQSSQPFIPSKDNPAVQLGTLMGTNHNNGRDKVTFVFSESLQYFGFWLEQLLAESTGKEGKGLVPIVGEELGSPDVYDVDRQFVYISLKNEKSDDIQRKLNALEKEGYPVVRIQLKDTKSLGAEFFRWEFATATAGKVIGINSFDEPNVAEAKQNTSTLLNEWEENGEFKLGNPLAEDGAFSVFADQNADWLFGGSRNTPHDFLNTFFGLIKPWDYVGILSYFKETEERNFILHQIRHAVRNKFKVATMLGYGPRYLHSTGQIHKGGANNGVFLILTADASETLQIPGEKYDFGTLHFAKALGDFRSLNNKNRRVIRVHLGDDIDSGLMTLKTIVE